MKKIIALFVAALLCCVFIIPASAAIPTALTFTQIEASNAPIIDGTVDASYGSPIFDLIAKDIAIGDEDHIFMSDVMEDGSISADSGTYGGTEIAKNKFIKTYNTMRTVAYVTYDDKNLYLAFDTTDIAPKASENSATPWRSTNFQLCMYVNQRLAFFTVAYTGKNKVTIANDNRNEFDVDVMKAALNEKSQNNFVYELVIPWSAAPGLKSAKDVEDFRFGYVQSSMAEAYICTSIGTGWAQKYEKLVPVTMKNLSGEDTKPSTNSSDATGTVDDGTSAPSGGGTSININNDNDSTNTETNNDTNINNEDDEVIVVEEGKDNSKMIIILACVGGVILVAGVVAVILLNKKPAGEKKD